MPDATGTPTTNFSIPKYNTGTDPPSGKGFNTAMDFIDALLANNATLLGARSRLAVRLNSGGSDIIRRRINFIEGTGIDLTITDDAGNEEVDVTIASTASGGELDYVEKTSNTSISATTEATANTVITANAVNFDGSTPVLIEFFSPAVQHPAGSATIRVVLFQDGSAIGVLSDSFFGNEGATVMSPVYAARKLTPASGSRTYSIRAYMSSAGTGTVVGGTGAAGTYMPAFIRITEI